jgi:hypothetical protein
MLPIAGLGNVVFQPGIRQLSVDDLILIDQIVCTIQTDFEIFGRK